MVLTPSLAAGILALLLVYPAGVYSSAVWASTAAEGIVLTPFRRLYLRSAQNTQGVRLKGAQSLRAIRYLAAPAVALRPSPRRAGGGRRAGSS